MSKTNTVVIYHKSDFDGIFCREIARKFLPGAELIGWEYGEPTPAVPPEATLYIMDLSVPDLMEHPNLIWIDHHKTAIEKYSPKIPGYRIDGVAACRLAWQWFHGLDRYRGQAGPAADMKWFKSHYPFPRRQDFIDRGVIEPLAVRLAGEYDIWDKRDPGAELFQHGLRSQDLSEETWDSLLSGSFVEQNRVVGILMEQGEVVAYAETRKNELIIGNNGFTRQWEGLTFLCCNAGSYNSHLFTAGIKPEHDGLLGFCLRKDGKWSISLYGVPGKPDVDLATIAAKYGGGGHKQACGFKVDKLPFLS